MLKISLTTSGLLDKSTLEAWTRQKQAAIHKAVATGMQAGGKSVADLVRSKMKSDVTVKKAAFVNSLRTRVYDRNPDKLPAVLIGSKIPWLGIHVRGGPLSGRMLIPLTEEGRRIGRRAFKRVIDTLIRSGNAVGLLPGLLWAGEPEPLLDLTPLPGDPRREIFSSARVSSAHAPAIRAVRDALARAAR